ncbi:synaptic vesicle glycoprotein 2B-like [Aricia agestis]|uniref:synaptic vesicle glycoprotein 2B-like n=1 Tax=Aricia agestis TaxID=91739 RepID=UPI001C2028DD|nr:synaptic vesicle glycoprotein 2B-like [Aricia agestis]
MVAKIKVDFEDALTLAGFGKFNVVLTLATISVILSMTFEIFSVSYLVPASACELKTSVPQQGLMAAVPMLGIIATSHIWGYLADTRGRTTVLAWCMTLSFIFGSLNTLAPNWIVFSVLKFFSSCAIAGTYALAITLLSECTLESWRSKMVALTSTVFLGSTATMAILSVPVLQLNFSYDIPALGITFNSWRLLNLVYALPCAIGTLCMYLSYESPRYLVMVGEEEKALEVLRGIFSINTGKPKEEYKVESVALGEESGKPTKGLIASIISQTVPLLKPPLLKKTILLSIMFIIVYFGINPFIVWLPFIADAIMTSIRNGDKDFKMCDMIRSSQNATAVAVEAENQDCSLDSYAMMAVFGTNTILATLNIGLSSLINVVGRKRMLIAIQFFAGAAGLCINLSSIWQLNAVLLVGYVLGVLNFGYISTICVEVFPTYVKAMAVCLTLMVGRGSSVLGINVLKNMMVSNCEAALYMFPSLTFAGGIFAFCLPGDNEKPQKKVDDAET